MVSLVILDHLRLLTMGVKLLAQKGISLVREPEAKVPEAWDHEMDVGNAGDRTMLINVRMVEVKVERFELWLH